MRRRGWWPLSFALTHLSEPAPWPKGPMWTDPARKAHPHLSGGNEGAPTPGANDPVSPRPLSWDVEDRAVAAGECPWHPDLDFPDARTLLRHVIQHARAWEAEALHVERLRRALLGRVAEFAAEIRAGYGDGGGRSP